MQVAGAFHTPPPSSFGGTTGGASTSTSAWDDDDHALMELLLEPMETENSNTAVATSASPPPAAMASVATIDAKSKNKAKLTSTEKKARHREVVRRSYHRNKATVKVLQDEVKQLEDKFRALTAGRGADQMTAGAPAGGTDDDTLVRVDAMKEQVSSLDATSEQLRKESVKLQSVLLRHQEYARVVVETFESDLMEETSSEEEDDATSSTTSFGASTTSEEDRSPVKTAGVKRALYAIARPTHVVDLAQPAPIDRDARKDIGYATLTSIDAKLISNAAVSDIVNFTLSGRVVSSGGHVLGWEDRRLIDGATVKFSLRKAFPRETAYELMAKTWQCFSDPECARQKFRGLMELRILQRVNDDTVIALRDTLNPENNKVYRFVYMLFRMRTSRGFLIGVKSIEDPKFITQQLKHRFTREGREIQWVDLSGWFLFDRQGYMDPRTGIPVETGVEVEYGGMMNYGDVSHTMMLAMNSLSLVLKWESFFVHPIFSLPSSSDQ